MVRVRRLAYVIAMRSRRSHMYEVRESTLLRALAEHALACGQSGGYVARANHEHREGTIAHVAGSKGDGPKSRANARHLHVLP